MTPTRWRQIEELYDAASRLPQASRAALLNSADPESRSIVEHMLASNRGDQVQNGPGAATFDTTETVIAQTIFGPYKITGLIGAGGMGAVYSAVDTRLDRQVALKIGAAKYSDRFQREARAISTLNHPHICTLYDVGPDYLVMELIQGVTLAAEIQKRPLDPAQVARYGAQIAGALAEAHARGIVHRDLKPGNIMLAQHGIKVLDFGLASILSDAGFTASHVVMGTPAYMAPEQIAGGAAMAATDLFALGLVLYEMAVGHLPFPGASLGQMLSSGSTPVVLPPSRLRAGLPAGLDALIAKLLEKDPAARGTSASEAAAKLTVLADQLTAAPRFTSRAFLKPRYLIPALAILLLIVAGGTWAFQGWKQRQWAREQAIPEIQNLSRTQPLAAFFMLRKAAALLPDDPQLRQITQATTMLTSVNSQPPGARVEIQDYTSPHGEWLALGTTPLKNARIPKGYFRWRLSTPREPQFVSAPRTAAKMQFTMPPDPSSGMVPVPDGWTGEMIDFVGMFKAKLPAFDVDRFEVTNARYQDFVDQGGYRRPEFWQEKFVDDGKALTWEQAMARFRDPTGRSGPSTWEGGHFPPGRANYPVSGISWYEASAYAAFAGKALPTLIQWYAVAPSDFVFDRINQSNFDPRGPVPVTSSGGDSPYGALGLNGNVREWVVNTVDDDRRFILGGAWRTQTYQAYDPEALPPFDRSELNGFRCVRNKAALPPEVLAPVVRQSRDFSKVKPVSDEVFHAFRLMYAYDRTPVDPHEQGPAENGTYWTRQRLDIDAGYRGDRLPLYVFLPKNVRPPFQAVVFFPSARVNGMPSSAKPGDMDFVDYIVKSGRALIYPIYNGTYERFNNRKAPGAVGSLNRIIENSKEVRRSLDYLETRSDIDKTKLAYLGVSQGAAEGVIYVAMEPRFRTAVFLDGGFFLCDCAPGQDQVDFVPRVKIPVLMMNGRYDFTFSPERSQEPFFRMLGTPEAEKRRVLFDTPHDLSQQKAPLSKEVLEWLDKYLGKVN